MYIRVYIAVLEVVKYCTYSQVPRHHDDDDDTKTTTARKTETTARKTKTTRNATAQDKTVSSQDHLRTNLELVFGSSLGGEC